MAGETAMKNSNAGAAPEFWRTTEEWAQTPEFQEMLTREFPDDIETWTDPVSRRKFLTLMSASIALAGLAGCSPRPASQRKILPYSKQPEGLIPGVPNFYASTAVLGGIGSGVLVKSYEGRPIKIEGNPDHPSSGGTDIFTQAFVLELYDPDRAQSVSFQGVPRTWEEAIGSLRAGLEKLKDKDGAGIRILTGTVTSPTLADSIAKFRKRYPMAAWTQFEPLTRDNVRDGAVRAFGDAFTTTYDFSHAKVVLALDCDFLTALPGSVRYARDFMRNRRVRKHDHADGGDINDMSRLYAVESMLTPTGSVADHRLSLKSSEVEAFARALAAEIAVQLDRAKKEHKLQNVKGSPPAKAISWLTPLAEDLVANMGHSVVIAGDQQPAAVHALVHAINDALKNAGKTVKYSKPIEASPDAATAKTSSHHGDLRTLVADLKSGKVEMLLILGANPVYAAPADIDFGSALEKAGVSIHLGLYANETALRCHWHIPEAHTLESWGDARCFDGTASIIQPLIAPLWAGRSALELMTALGAKLEDGVQTGHEAVMAYWRTRWLEKNKGKDESEFDGVWQKWLRDGVIADSAHDLEVNVPTLLATWAAKSDGSAAASGMEINFRADPTIYDGRFANNGWLQELPKPVTKLCWENAVIMSPNTAEKLGIPEPDPRWTAGERGRMETEIVEITAPGRPEAKPIKAPVWIQPGHADDSVTVYLGYGREQAGKVGNNIGFNAYKQRTSDALWFRLGVDINKTGEKTFLANTQAFYSMQGRKPVRRVTSNVFHDLESKDEETRKKAAKELDEAMAPAAAASERNLIELPGPNERSEKERDRAGLDHSHDHGHEHKHEHEHKHDKRLTPLSMYDDTNKVGRRWAMTIDLSSCIGCNACMIACMAENNIPILGKYEVSRGREMYWIRVDRYYSLRNPDLSEKARDPERIKDPDSLAVYFQPVPCQQCEKAPCEVVCPVGATLHSTDGLNDMVYNRCVGTRYCSNNCPYKVRRFNFLTYADWNTESLKLGRNPDVTVRSRGVMEKCTYCVQKIRQAEIVAEREYETRPKVDGRPRIDDGEIKTACELVCPSQAIVFGDLSDKGSAVRRWKDEPTNYGLLAELNTMPRTSYLAAVRNPNPKMPKGA
jgi:MoCo/4Fe-4S cofactor protein with predicted Tat translocation signal